MRAAMLVVFCVSFAIATNAEPPPNITPDPELQAWFKALSQPTTRQPCCSISDCRFTKFQLRDGHYEVEIDHWPVVIPDRAILHAVPNPYGKAVVCYSYDIGPPEYDIGSPGKPPHDPLRVSCFVPPGILS